MSKFQIILLSVFGAFIIIGVLIFSISKGGGSIANTKVTLWGDISATDFNNLVSTVTLSSDKTIPTLVYVEKASATFDSSFTEALAEGKGPDLVLISEDQLWQEKAKLVPIPYTSITERTFKDTFVQEGELFLSPEGIYALPLYVDPMMLYWNRDLLSSAGLAKPLSFWDEIYDVSAKLTKKDNAGNITKSTIALGEELNIPHAKDILALLMLEAGTPITSYFGEAPNVALQSQISNNFGLPTTPAVSALDFYTQFSNSAKPFYTWNRSLLPAQTEFISGDSALYLGFASEARILRAKNPNLNFAIALVPQSRVSGNSLTLGRIHGLALVRGGQSVAAALTLAEKLVGAPNASALSKIISLPPARRDLLSQKSVNPDLSIFFDAALQAHSWIDPNPTKTQSLFNDMIDNVTSGRSFSIEAVGKTNDAVNVLIKQ